MLSEYKLAELIESHIAMGLDDEDRLFAEMERAYFEEDKGCTIISFEELTHPDPDPDPVEMAIPKAA